MTNVFTGDCEVVPDGLAPDEIEPVILDVLPTLGFVPGTQNLIVVTKYKFGKGRIERPNV